MDFPLIPIRYVMNRLIRHKCANLILAALSYTLNVVFVRGGQDTIDNTHHMSNGLICVVHLGKYFPYRPGFFSGGIKYLLKQNGWIVDITVQSGFGVVHNALRLEIVPLMKFMQKYGCTVQVIDNIGLSGNLEYLRYMMTSIQNNRDKGQDYPKMFDEVIEHKNMYDVDLYTKFASKIISENTFRYAYVWTNAIRYKGPITEILSFNNSVTSLRNLSMGVVRRQVRDNLDNVLHLREELPDIILAELLNQILPSLWHRARTYYRPSTVDVTCRALDIDISTIAMVELLPLLNKDKNIKKDVVKAIMMEHTRKNYAFMHTPFYVYDENDRLISHD